MKTELKKDRMYLTENTAYIGYSETEIKMLDVGEALLISEPKIKFMVPTKFIHYQTIWRAEAKRIMGFLLLQRFRI